MEELGKNAWLNTSLPPAAQFALATASAGFSPAARLLAHSLLPKVEPGQAMDFARRHGILPLFCWNIREGHIPAPGFENLDETFQRLAQRSLLLTRELFRVLDLLARDGITAVAHKGPALAVLLYGNPVLRVYDDVDILIAPRQASAARELLARNGWRCNENFLPAQERAHIRTGYEFTFVDARGQLLELQWRAAPRFYAFDFDFELMMRRAVMQDVAGRPAMVLCSEDLLLMLVAHAAKHLWERLSWSIDIAALLQSEAVNWETAARSSCRYGIRRILAVALSAATGITGISLPPPAEALVREAREQESARIFIVNAATDANQFKPASAAYFHMVLQLRERWRDRLKILLRLSLTPGTGEWQAVHLPAGLFPLYTLVRIYRLFRRALGWKPQPPSAGET